MRLMPMEEYNSKDQFIIDHKHVLKELGVKNTVQLIYLLFILNDILAEHDTSMKNYIDETFQKQVAQFEATEVSNDTPVSTLIQPMETEIFENVEHQSLINVEHNDQNIEHQSEDVIAESSTKNSKKSVTKLNAKATPYTLKGKGRTVTFAEMASRNLDAGSNCDTSPSPPGNRSKNNETKRKASDSKAQSAKKKQHAPIKEIQLVMTGYDPVLRDNVREITLYNILSTWAQIKLLQHLKKWGHVIAFKTKRQKKLELFAGLSYE
ncbi:hypothetical protein RhiirA5_426007 [Rhizophagus irregularis]|uniref:Uncharacterized protein n=1 Tax=Rhizophagus irregularis TaxID=588596 RepID=A0A2N0P506_9GLOM|nr:hypothetical protein RhiirA5_426007 [Rhizophagus irregularis]